VFPRTLFRRAVEVVGGWPHIQFHKVPVQAAFDRCLDVLLLPPKSQVWNAVPKTDCADLIFTTPGRSWPELQGRRDVGEQEDCEEVVAFGFGEGRGRHVGSVLGALEEGRQ
jgi:hypothetical protein